MPLGMHVLLATIGAGGMGEVWKARSTRLHRMVAVKRLKGQHSARFGQEARSIAALNHAHICQIFDIRPDYLVLEYVEEQSLLCQAKPGPLPSNHEAAVSPLSLPVNKFTAPIDEAGIPLEFVGLALTLLGVRHAKITLTNVAAAIIYFPSPRQRVAGYSRTTLTLSVRLGLKETNMTVDPGSSFGKLLGQLRINTTPSIGSSMRPNALSLLLLVITACGPLSAQQPILCNRDTPKNGGCMLAEFDRPRNWIGKVGEGSPKDGPNVTPGDDLERSGLVWAINSPGSKILYSGTIISVPYDGKPPEDCAGSDWKVVVLSQESSNVLVYGPADISEFCFDIVDPLSKKPLPKKVLLVVPVAVIWAEVFRYSGNALDPLRKAPGPVPWPDNYCGQSTGKTELSPFPPSLADGPDTLHHIVPGGIRPCDLYRHSQVYGDPLGRAYNRLTQPGTSQGTISFIPAIGIKPTGPLKNVDTGPKENLNFDVQLYPSGVWGPGWIGLPVVFEKANTNAASLDSLTAALSYDIPFSRFRPQSSHSVGDCTVCFSIRPPDFRIQSLLSG